MDQERTLLIIDDDAKLTEALQLYLSKRGFRILAAQDGLQGLQECYRSRPDVVLLDIMMPNMDGWEACQRIREISSVPIIMLTARGQTADKVKGFELGADDYICKPFDMRELVARLDALLRRTSGTHLSVDRALFADEELVIDPGRWEVRRKGNSVNLTPTEMRFLFFLVENADRVLTHQQILDHVWGSEYVDDTGYTKLFVWRLRQKLEVDPSSPRYIITERGVGYRFCSRA
ncbi:MAG: response regulator transcription factor [Anaerolineae bacterium]